MAARAKVGFIGCGNIFGAYVRGCRAFEILEVAACADILPEKARAAAAEHGVAKAVSVEELLADDSVDIVVNLTVPLVHAQVSQSILDAGHHLYSEKPLAIDREDGREVMASAGEKGLLVGCAPDTFLGGGQQTCRKLIDDGWIGEPVGATAFMLSRGPESWHPNPAFFYQPGAGPLFDMAPYYLTALVHLLGPIRRVAGATRITFAERIATSEARFGERLPVSVPTHSTALLDFAGGPIAALITSFDVWSSTLPRIEIYGSEGTLIVPDPNIFGGPVRLRRPGDDDWRDMPLSHSDAVRRGVGVADMAYAIKFGRQHRASGDMAYHVLDVMQAVEESSTGDHHIMVESDCPRPKALPLGLLPGRLDQ
ncbi:MAG: Gfo/Idh/MocA family oxidoreductase [Chloroflexota bacterium]|nr:MAG: Gfo/Idh/MocA family oxidoreductase [Chloroflexota bacterium]